MDIWTIGYEKAGLGDLLATLAAAGVTRLVDVRDLPLSRRAGFSKRQLAASAEEAGIAYTHLKALGTPKEGRTAHRSHDMKRFQEIVARSLARPEAQAALVDLLALAEAERCCLICYEADWRLCHRARIVEEMAERSAVTAHHLTVEPRFP